MCQGGECVTRRIFAFTRAFWWKETLFLCVRICVIKFFMELLVYPVIVFCFGMPQVQFLPYVYRELKTAFVMWCEDPFLGGGGGVVP